MKNILDVAKPENQNDLKVFLPFVSAKSH